MLRPPGPPVKAGPPADAHAFPDTPIVTAETDNVRAEVVIGGRVQGVFFRAHARQMAGSLGLTGWVRNRYDGKVEAVFEGPRDSVRRMAAWCYRGPRLARVTDVDLDWQDATGEFTDFSVRY